MVLQDKHLPHFLNALMRNAIIFTNKQFRRSWSLNQLLVAMETKWWKEIITRCPHTTDGWSNVDSDGFQFLRIFS